MASLFPNGVLLKHIRESDGYEDFDQIFFINNGSTESKRFTLPIKFADSDPLELIEGQEFKFLVNQSNTDFLVC